VIDIFALSPLDGRYREKVFGLESIVSEYGLIFYRVKVELLWFKYLFSVKELNLGSLSVSEVAFIDQLITDFSDEDAKKIKDIEIVTNHDVKAVEYFIKDKFKQYPNLHENAEFIHFGCTSEDINNLSYALMLFDSRTVLVKSLHQLIESINFLAKANISTAMMSRTHGQPATPTTLGKELYNFIYRFKRQINKLINQEIFGKLNGAVGNYNAFFVCFSNVNWENISKDFITKVLGLEFNPFTTQIEPHDYIAEYMNTLKVINTIAIDCTRDVWGYISLGYFTQKLIANEVGSSTMPHKINPINFENAEGNLGVANSLAAHLADKLPISRWQRDLSDSTVLRNIGMVISYSVLSYTSLIEGFKRLGVDKSIIDQDLANHWELLAEPIQMMMRKHKVPGAYEKLKELTRGNKINGERVRDFIMQLEKVPDQDKQVLLKLTPALYTGIAEEISMAYFN
jgi:adenylosuccinate lyase